MRTISTMLFAFVIFAIVFVECLLSSVSFRSVDCETKIKLGSHQELKIIDEEVQQVVLMDSSAKPVEIDKAYHGNRDTGNKPTVPEQKKVSLLRKKKLRKRKLNTFRATQKTGEFDSRVNAFLRNGGSQCQVQFFMTWISPAESFRGRQFLALDSLFKNNQNACLIILSKELDSGPGRLILKPLINRGYRVAAFDPDLTSLFKNTPAEAWLKDIQSGHKDAGEIPLAQNLSNLMRLAALYKYGGVYLDTDFIVLRDFSGLRNAIGAQSVDSNGKWTRLNNAVLIFDKNHPLLDEFMKEFQCNFDGNKWGYNGPYLVSRVTDKVTKQKRHNFRVLPPVAFYPVDWTRIDGFFKRPNDPAFVKWAEAKLLRLERGNETYGIHLWNRQTGRMKIEKGSIMAELISRHCIICQSLGTS